MFAPQFFSARKRRCTNSACAIPKPHDYRDEFLLQCAQSRRLLEGFLCRTWLVEGDVTSFQPFAAARAQRKAYSEAARGQKGHQMEQPIMSVFVAFVNGLVTETPGTRGLAEVEVAWLNEFRKQLTSATEVGRFLEMWKICETGRINAHSRYRMRTPDPALPEDAQSINKLAHILRKVLPHRKGIEQESPAPTKNNERKLQSQLEQRRKRVEGQYTQKKRIGSTSTRLTSLSRWPSGPSRMKTSDHGGSGHRHVSSPLVPMHWPRY